MPKDRLHLNLIRSDLLALSIVLSVTLTPFALSPASGQDAVNPDTPVSSEAPSGTGNPNTSVSSDGASSSVSPASGGSAPFAGTGSSDISAPAGGSDLQGAVSPASSGAEIGSQVTVKTTVSHEQEKKDRLFVDATFFAVAVILCAIAFFLFMSLPKQPKKTGNDSVQ
jgi:hypothetical protein